MLIHFETYLKSLKNEEIRQEQTERAGDVTNLSSTVRSLLHTETNKGGVRHFDQDIIYTIHMDELDPPSLHVIYDALVPQRSVQTPVPI